MTDFINIAVERHDRKLPRLAHGADCSQIDSMAINTLAREVDKQDDLLEAGVLLQMLSMWRDFYALLYCPLCVCLQ